MSTELSLRLKNLNEYFTYSVYANICRSLFEKHKLLFSFLLTIKILQGAGTLDAHEWRFLISGMAAHKKDLPNPDPSWIEPNVWSEICTLAGLPAFTNFPAEMASSLRQWKEVFDSTEPQNMAFPIPYHNFKGMQRMCVLRCLRRDKIMEVGEVASSSSSSSSSSSEEGSSGGNSVTYYDDLGPFSSTTTTLSTEAVQSSSGTTTTTTTTITLMTTVAAALLSWSLYYY